ncbi:MAG: lipid kinase [Minwuia sp.]|nr:lipid kinase [Minwuia sp.]
MNRETLIIINRLGGGATRAIANALQVMREGGLSIDLVRPDHPEQISDVIRDRGPAAGRIIIGGGDGTMLHSAPALLDAGRPVGLLPLGTANDLARTLDIPSDPVQAARVIVQGQTRRIDLGTVNGRPYFNVASLGFSAHVARHHSGERKRRLKLLSYPLSWMDAQRDTKPFRLKLTDRDGKTRSTRTTLLAIGNGVYYGGGMRIVDDAAIDDGNLDVFYVRPLGPLGMLRVLPLLRFGAIRRKRDIRAHRVRWLRVETKPQQQINVDGELVEQTPAEFSILPQALEFHVPDPTWTGELTGETGWI